MSDWHPQSKQEFVLSIPPTVFEILFGGSRGGGKTDVGIVWLTDYIDNPQYRALVIRKNYTDLVDWMDRALYLYRKYGAQAVSDEIRWPSGAKFRLGHLKDRNSYEKYLGHEYQRLLIEELTQVPREEDYVKILGSVRSTVKGLEPQVFCTTNPTGSGHAWVKKRFVDPGPPNKPFTGNDGRRKIYIPATIEDNPALYNSDPGYVKYLEGLKNSDYELYKAWRLGSWDIFAGQVFREWDYSKHILQEFKYPLSDCKKIIGFDWGYNDPGVAEWLAYTPDQRVYAYREIYQNETTPQEWAYDIKKWTDIEKVENIVLPHDCFIQMYGGKSIAQIFQEIIGIPIVHARSQEKNARLNRLAILHQYLSDAPDGLPYLQVHYSCQHLIKTLPELVYSETNIEYLEDGQDDHAFDSATYGLMSRSTFKVTASVIKPSYPKQSSNQFVQDSKGRIRGPDFWSQMAKGTRHTTANLEK